MKKTILVIDDEPAYLELLRELLSQYQFAVLTAENGAEALKILKGGPVDVIISDIEMPVLNGIALHAQLQYSAELKSIPFVFLSGSENPDVLTYASQQSNVVFVPKAQVPQTLVAALENLAIA